MGKPQFRECPHSWLPAASQPDFKHNCNFPHPYTVLSKKPLCKRQILRLPALPTLKLPLPFFLFFKSITTRFKALNQYPFFLSVFKGELFTLGALKIKLSFQGHAKLKSQQPLKLDHGHSRALPDPWPQGPR